MTREVNAGPYSKNTLENRISEPLNADDRLAPIEWLIDDLLTTIDDAAPEELPSQHAKLAALVLGLQEREQEWHPKYRKKHELQTAKAYGGCTNCYGRGYSTVDGSWHGYDTDTDIGSPGGKVQGGDLFEMKYCGCSRGGQLKSQLKKHELQAKIEELANQREGYMRGMAHTSEAFKYAMQPLLDANDWRIDYLKKELEKYERM